MISAEAAQKRAAETLPGFPPEISAAYIAYASTGDATQLDAVVLGVLQFHLAKPPPQPLTALPGSTRLKEDLGVDSLTMVDTLFLSESLFDITLADDELAKVGTLDELLAHFRRQLPHSGPKTPAATIPHPRCNPGESS